MRREACALSRRTKRKFGSFGTRPFRREPGWSILPASCSLAAPSAVNISMRFRMESRVFSQQRRFACTGYIPGWATRRVHKRWTPSSTAAATSCEVLPRFRSSAKQPQRTSSLASLAEYFTSRRPLRSSRAMLMQPAACKNRSSQSRSASYKHHWMLLAFFGDRRRLLLPVRSATQAALKSSRRGAACKTNV